MNFTGTDDYVASKDLQMAVNAAVALQKPLLIKGEPGTGKTLLAFEVAKALNKTIYTWHVKSTSKAQQGLYEYDAVARLRDSQLGDEKVKDIAHYINKGPVWKAFESEEQAVLLIDEILSFLTTYCWSWIKWSSIVMNYKRQLLLNIALSLLLRQIMSEICLMHFFAVVSSILFLFLIEKSCNPL
jgi:predicted ATP-dependent serine protease